MHKMWLIGLKNLFFFPFGSGGIVGCRQRVAPPLIWFSSAPVIRPAKRHDLGPENVRPTNVDNFHKNNWDFSWVQHDVLACGQPQLCQIYWPYPNIPRSNRVVAAQWRPHLWPDFDDRFDINLNVWPVWEWLWERCWHWWLRVEPHCHCVEN